MKTSTAYKCLLAGLFVGCSLLPAADASLRVIKRRDHRTQQEESGSDRARGYILLRAVDEKAKISLIPGELRASITLPLKDVLQIKAIIPEVQFSPQNGPDIAHFRVELTPEQEAQIE